MEYTQIVEGTFESRPNRFIAQVKVDGVGVVSHVKNTGRCRELLIPGARVFLEYHPEAAEGKRKTAYDLIGVCKGDTLINMDSQAPNRAAWEWICSEHGPRFLLPDGKGRVKNVRREVVHGDSRFDLAFELESGDLPARPAFMEVKGVTLEENGVAMFPDAPTERGIKHLNGLARAVQEGYLAYALFVIQMKGVHLFTPNAATHPAFGEALKKAREAGVRVLAFDCRVTERTLDIADPVAVRL
ncbi:MAG: DNA/RNA nuclease SfsA [Enterocloster asparagiformis]|nr:DNA/RNA nuclease SfsA [Enterocloster asparagiformis]